ncbi:type I methionyl aminopeptidase [bacterium]|nr:type I methionyl aminopeptidase [bacterium]|tara:strand:+ start:75 stop:857 length:783 start_codon:yes stop_codon:yes gene_type:complete
MSTIKKPEEIEIIREGGKILSGILREVVAMTKPGVGTAELDDFADKAIVKAGGRPSFKNFSEGGSTPFPTTLCTSVNEELVHVPAKPDRKLKDGDIIGLDIGMEYPFGGGKPGLYTDMAITVAVGQIHPETQKLLDVTRKSLDMAIAAIKPGLDLSIIGKTIQPFVEAAGFSVIRQLVGHGVGYEVHEPPRVHNFFEPKAPQFELKPGMVLAVEPMVAVGNWQIETLDDGWTIAMADRTLSAHFEHTIVVTETGAEILTQ